jgi:hypothetical protein
VPRTSSHSAKDQNNQTPTKRRGALSSKNFQETTSPELLNSTAVAWVWIPVGPYRMACNRDQTLGLRSVVPSTSSSGPYYPTRATQSCRGAKLYCSCVAYQQYRVSRLQATPKLSGSTASPQRNLVRLPVTAGMGNPDSVEILCKP